MRQRRQRRKAGPSPRYGYHLLRGLATAVGMVAFDRSAGSKPDVMRSLVAGAAEAATSFVNEMGLGNGLKAYEQRKALPVSTQTAAMTRLGVPMVECDCCGSTMAQPPIDAIYETKNRAALWVYGNSSRTEEGSIYFTCSPRCHTEKRLEALKQGYNVR